MPDVAQHHGLQINPERLIDEYALGAEEPGNGALLRMAADIGMKAKVRQADLGRPAGSRAACSR
jgi:subfamily B ATP-binding cassette protein HlyB/CyaB